MKQADNARSLQRLVSLRWRIPLKERGWRRYSNGWVKWDYYASNVYEADIHDKIKGIATHSKANRGMGITATDSGSTCHAKQQSDG